MSSELSSLFDGIDPDEVCLAIESRLYRGSFVAFLQAAWSEITGFDLVDAPHVRLLCRHLEAVGAGDISRLLVNLPPGLFKSTVLVAWMAWTFANDPSHEFLFYSYSAPIALQSSTKCRDLLRSEWFRDRSLMLRLPPTKIARRFSNSRRAVHFAR